MALTLAAVMMRRTRLAMLAGEATFECAPVAAELMAKELGWDLDEVRNQLSKFVCEFKREYSASPGK